MALPTTPSTSFQERSLCYKLLSQNSSFITLFLHLLSGGKKKLELGASWKQSLTCISCCACVPSHSVVSDALWPRGPRQVPLSIGFSRQEYWGGLSCSPPGDLPNSRIKAVSLMFPALAARFFTTSTTWEAPGGNIEMSLTVVTVRCQCLSLLSSLHDNILLTVW